jgi:murein tripeptide amidase MpaA
MMNPDGVVVGNYRTGLSGRDFNREYINPDSALFVEIHSVKAMLQRFKYVYQKDFNLFVDFHGHTVKKNIFTYGP